MFSFSIKLLENMCRTCMSEEEPEYLTSEKDACKAFISIFNKPQVNRTCSNITVTDILTQSIPQLTVEPNDLLPKNVCKACLDKLISMYEFQQKCLTVEQKLKSLIKEFDDTLTQQAKDMDDPLTDEKMQETFADLRSVLKIEMDEPLIDTSTMENNGLGSSNLIECTIKSNDWGENVENDTAGDSCDIVLKQIPSRSLRNQKVKRENSLDCTRGRRRFDDKDTEDSTLTCKQCGRKLKTLSSLRRHEKIHLPLPENQKKMTTFFQKIKYDNESETDNVERSLLSKVKKNTESDMNNVDILSVNQNLDEQTLGTHTEPQEKKPFVCNERESRLKTRKSLTKQLLQAASYNSEHCDVLSKWKHINGESSDDSESDILENKILENNCDQNTVDNTLIGDKEIQQYVLEPELRADKPYVCDECGSRLKTRKSLKRHKRIHLRLPGAKVERSKTKHVCEYCQKVFCQSSSLKDHLRVHTGEQPYLCSECGKAFTSLSNMKQHFLRHGTARPYECPDCPKKFPCHSDLASHKAVHSKAKTHVCDICGAGFVKPYLLKKHKMYHTGEKNHKCDYCTMRFVLADQCRRHMRTHTGEKPYKCKYCVRAFAQSNDLIKHLRGHLGDKVYKCDLCPQGFRLQGELRTHFNSHKNDNEETRIKNLEALKEDELRLQLKFNPTAIKDT